MNCDARPLDRVLSLLVAFLAVALTPVAHGQTGLSDVLPASPSSVDISLPAPAQASSIGATLDAIKARSVDALSDPSAVAGDGWQKQANTLIKKAHAQQGAALHTLRDQAQSASTTRLDALAQAQRETGTLPDLAPAIRYRIFVSQSMGEDGLKQAFMIAKAHPDVVLAFRGMLEGQKLPDFYRALGEISGQGRDLGTGIGFVVIDPPSFTDGNVTVVPTMQRLDDDGAPVATVRGLINPDWIERAVTAGDTGDLGKQGATYAISEPNIMEVMIAEVKKIDMQAWKEKAFNSYWDTARLYPVPAAIEARQREIDPTVTVTRDVVTPDGTVLAKKGERYNPLGLVGFHKTLLIFDATSKAQLDWAKGYITDHPDTAIKAITSSVDREHGWPGFWAAEKALGVPLYVLGLRVKDTFKIEHVPTIVSADSRVFTVEEVPIPLQQGDDHLGETIHVRVLSSHRWQVRIGITAPRDVKILRDELPDASGMAVPPRPADAQTDDEPPENA